MKLEVGKKYLTRSGLIATVNGSTDAVWPFFGDIQDNPSGISEPNFWSWKADGSFGWATWTEAYDLVSEVPQEKPRLDIAVGRKFVTRGGDIAEITGRDDSVESHGYIWDGSVKGYPGKSWDKDGFYFSSTLEGKQDLMSPVDQPASITVPLSAIFSPVTAGSVIRWDGDNFGEVLAVNGEHVWLTKPGVAKGQSYKLSDLKDYRVYHGI